MGIVVADRLTWYTESWATAIAAIRVSVGMAISDRHFFFNLFICICHYVYNQASFYAPANTPWTASHCVSVNAIFPPSALERNCSGVDDDGITGPIPGIRSI